MQFASTPLLAPPAALAALAPASAARAASQAFAAPSSAVPAALPGAAGLGQVTLALGIVLVAIFLVAWVARRLRGVGRSSGGSIEVVADVALGQKERAVLLKIGATRLLVGVAPGQVRTLHVLGEDLAATATPAVATAEAGRPAFRDLLLRSLGR